MKSKDYQPISCTTYDELALLSMHKKQVDIVYELPSGKKQTVNTVIRDIYTKDSEEFLLTESGEPIRLDQLIHERRWQTHGR